MIPSNEGVLYGVGECMAQVERACDVGGRDDHHELLVVSWVVGILGLEVSFREFIN